MLLPTCITDVWPTPCLENKAPVVVAANGIPAFLIKERKDAVAIFTPAAARRTARSMPANRDPTSAAYKL